MCKFQPESDFKDSQMLTGDDTHTHSCRQPAGRNINKIITKRSQDSAQSHEEQSPKKSDEGKLKESPRRRFEATSNFEVLRLA